MEVRLSRRQLHVVVHQDASLSYEARRALLNGVPLIINVDTEVRDARSLTLLVDEVRRLEVRYLPLSKRFQLSTPGEEGASKNFPRLRHVLAELDELDLVMGTGPLAPGDYEFRVRVRLDRSSLPMPLQLPAALNRAWRHDSGWSQWPFKVSA